MNDIDCRHEVEGWMAYGFLRSYRLTLSEPQSRSKDISHCIIIISFARNDYDRRLRRLDLKTVPQIIGSEPAESDRGISAVLDGFSSVGDDKR